MYTQPSRTRSPTAPALCTRPDPPMCFTGALNPLPHSSCRSHRVCTSQRMAAFAPCCPDPFLHRAPLLTPYLTPSHPPTHPT
jgi:hypothetical protein